MSLIIVAIFIILLNYLVNKFAANNRKKWFISAAVTILLIAPLVFEVTLQVIGRYSGDGIGGSVAGLTFAVIIFINGVVFLLIALFSKKVRYN
ncbi:hypothetical protein [Planomicrobium sp. CPCC 101079]|uniref:hypothetical protein n=1 Tax=Planomicrobium sp. CPCC 101079 TaxID=2599618 RepID=UPI0011B7C427|nr:hypothetical protein [Planomicrobium sp. CPCC 101079]TWT00166.1 hypothetical protein FQV28_18800 [Planomicrobium sp. CPCC 101079]